MANIQVSVIIPSYNRILLLERAIASVLNQKYKNFELIVVDDCSTDNIEELVNKFNDHRLFYIKHHDNKGANVARNTGIRAAIGSFISFLDSDDEWLPMHLEKQVDKMSKSLEEVGVIYCGYLNKIQESGKIAYNNPLTIRGDVFIELLKKCFLVTGTLLIRRKCFEVVGLFDESLPGCQDWDMWLRIARHFKFDYVPEVLTIIYKHGNQITSNLGCKISAREMLMDKYRNDLELYPKLLAKHFKRLGVLTSFAGNNKKAIDYLFKSINYNPRQIVTYVHLLLALTSSRLHKYFITKANIIENIEGIFYYY